MSKKSSILEETQKALKAKQTPKAPVVSREVASTEPIEEKTKIEQPKVNKRRGGVERVVVSLHEKDFEKIDIAALEILRRNKKRLNRSQIVKLALRSFNPLSSEVSDLIEELKMEDLRRRH